MTAISAVEKKSSVCNEQASADPNHGSTTRSGCRRSAAVAALVVICTLITTASLAVVLVGKLSQETATNKNQQWVAWIRKTGDINIHESVLIDVREQTVMMVSAESYKINEDNSLALHDFRTVFSWAIAQYHMSVALSDWLRETHLQNMDAPIEFVILTQEPNFNLDGNVAIRDYNANMCFVSKIQIPDFQVVKTMLERRQGKELPLQTLKKAHVTPGNMTSSQLGPRLSLFCQGVTARWFEIVTKSETKRQLDVPTHTACFIQRLEFAF